jgi:hypothetical protein
MSSDRGVVEELPPPERRGAAWSCEMWIPLGGPSLKTPSTTRTW